jgi:hypothetical protein
VCSDIQRSNIRRSDIRRSDILGTMPDIGPRRRDRMSTPSSGEADFGRALKALLSAAGLTPDRVLTELGDRRVLVSRTSLYDWMKNSHLPEDDGPVMEVVYLCLAAAKRRGVPVDPAPQDAARWRQLLADAKQARDGRAAMASRTGERGRGPARPGMPIWRWSPVALGVHTAIGGTLPSYARREHDDLLRALLNPAVLTSRMVVLRGTSSTGKTRAAYEAVLECLPGWLVDYPRTTTILAKRLREGFAPRTVVWLDELWRFTSPDAEVLAELGDMLTVNSQIVVIATLWPVHWAAYTRENGPILGTPFDDAEQPARLRADSLLGLKPLLKGLPELSKSANTCDPAFGGIIDVPDRFTEPEIMSARQQGDQAVVSAITAAEAAGAPGMVTQYLAGVPDLEEHYAGPGTDPYGRAVITAAVDAARFGHAGPFPEALLHQAVVGYLDDSLRTVDQERWWPRALQYATRELKGTVTALTPVPPATGTGVDGYRLADYLDQQGRRDREAALGPASLWDALTAHTAQSADLSRIGQSAYDRGMYRYAAVAWKKAIAAGGIGAIANLLSLLRRVVPDNCGQAAEWVAAHAAVDDPATAATAFEALREAGHNAAASALATEVVESVTLDDPDGLARLIRVLATARERAAIMTLGGRLTDSATESVRLRLVRRLREVFGQRAVASLTGGSVLDDDASAHGSATAPEADGESGDRQLRARQARLARRPGLPVTPVSAEAIAQRLRQLRDNKAEKTGQEASVLANRAAEQFPLDDPEDVLTLLRAFHDGGQREAVARLVARRPETRVALGNAKRISGLFRVLREAGHPGAALALGQRFAAHAPMNSPRGIDRVFVALVEAGERETAGLLARRAVARRALRPLALDLMHTWDGVFLIGEFYKAGEKEAALALAAQVIEEDGPTRRWRRDGVDDLLAIARRMHWDYGPGVARAITASLVDDDVVQGPLDNPWLVAANIKWLDRAVATDALEALLARHPANHVALQDPGGVAQLLVALRRLNGPAAAESYQALLARRPEEHVRTSDAGGLARLLNELLVAGAKEAVVTLVQRIIGNFEVSDALGAAALLRALRKAGAGDITALVRLAADQVDLTEPDGAIELLEMLAKLHLPEVTRDVARRAAQHAVLDNTHDVARLLDAVNGSGASQALPALANRAANTGYYAPLVTRGLADDFAFGREPDGTASRPWTWDDL